MTKYADYEELGHYLVTQDKALISMTFSEIESVVRRSLPKSSKYPAWWSNNPSNNAMTKVWLDAGFKTEQVDVNSRRVVFCRTGMPQANVSHRPTATRPSADSRHPLIGALKGTIRIKPGTDLTEPADPDWGNV